MVEFLLPIYFLLILIIVKLAIPNPNYPAIPERRGYPAWTIYTFLKSPAPIFVLPDNADTQNFISEVNLTWYEYTANLPDLDPTAGVLVPPTFLFLNSEEELSEVYSSNISSYFSLALILKDDVTKSKKYRVRNSLETVVLPNTNNLLGSEMQCRGLNFSSDPIHVPLEGACPTNGYYYSSLMGLQSLVDFTLTRLEAGTSWLSYIPHVMMESTPRPAFTDDAALYPLRAIVPLYMTLVLSQFITYLLTLVVGEKEKKIKEGMKMMGLRDSAFWLSWFVVYFCLVIFLASISTIILWAISVFQNTDYGLLFLLFILYGLSVISLGFMITAFFDKARVAGIFGALVVSFLNMLYYIQVFASGSDPAVFWALSLISPTGFALAMDKALLLDIQGVGLTWDTIWNGPDLPFAGGLIMVSVDILLYGFLAFYLDNVLPSEFGAKNKPWFIFTLSYWRGKSKKTREFESVDQNDNEADIEPVPRELQGKEVIRVRGIEKSFKAWGKPPVNAVQGVSLDFYEGQITAILGHNGAGKTTLINMLTGMMNPSKGTAYINDMDIRDPGNMSDIRKSFGVCPQHDILFDNLTPREHLEFFARIRGIPEAEIPDMVTETLADVDLNSKADTASARLSGGQKRKLSVGIALIGSPKIIFLDEPTAGVDPFSRRHLWEVLKKRKEGKCIFLTTHFMDEADILADRKAIVSHGKVRCCGSSLFLKNKFGIGYHLTFVASEDCKIEPITAVVQKHVPSAFINRRHGKELSYILPREETANFADLFEEIELKMKDSSFGVSSCGISMTTLEEVFLKLGEEEEEAWQKLLKSTNEKGAKNVTEGSPNGAENSAYDNSSDSGDSWETPGFAPEALNVSTRKSASRTLKAILKVRLLSLIREPQAVYFMVIAPILFTALGMFLGTLDVTQTQQQPLIINSTTYQGYSQPLLENLERASGLQNKFWEEFTKYTPYDIRGYNGTYDALLQELPSMGLFDVSTHKFATFADPAEGIHMYLNPVHQHLPGILTNTFNNVARRMAIFNETGTYPSDEIQVELHPMPYKTLPVQFSAGQFSSAIFIGMVFILTPTSMNIDLVQDRETRAKNQLRVNGLSFGLYFGSYFMVLGMMIMFTYGCLLALIQIFSIQSLTLPPAFASVSLIYLLYCPTALLYSACASYLFDKVETAQAVFPNVGIFLGFIPYIVVSLVDMLVDSAVAETLHIIFVFVDTVYIPFGAIYYIQKVYIECSFGGIYGTVADCSELVFSDYFSRPEIYVCALACVIMIPLLVLLLMVLDVKKSGGMAADAFSWLKVFGDSTVKSKVSDAEDKDNENEDSDVKEEKKRVAGLLHESSDDSVITIQGLRKEYSLSAEHTRSSGPCKKKQEAKRFLAVRDMTLGVQKGEIFGLLGHNGAGKTTTMRMVIAEEAPTKGMVIIDGHNIKSSLSDAFGALGYCPQFDAQWKNITVEEHLEAYCAIRGVDKDQISRLVKTFMDGLQIDEHKKKLSKNCSGGTKRKLSYAMSMLGQPKIVLMDEPSTGMDPQSKRFLWNTISSSFTEGKGAILTTHSMEEADALCSRIGIMVKGELRCLGSSQHLKNRYGSGYELEVKLRTTDDETRMKQMDKLRAFVTKIFPSSKMQEEFQDRVIYSVPQADIGSLAEVFRAIEDQRSILGIEEYSFSQTTLEQVFLRFAKLQESPYDEDDEQSDSL